MNLGKGGWEVIGAGRWLSKQAVTHIIQKKQKTKKPDNYNKMATTIITTTTTTTIQITTTTTTTSSISELKTKNVNFSKHVFLRMRNQTKNLVATCLWLTLFLFPAYKWFTKSDVVEPNHAASTPPSQHRQIILQPQSDVNAQIILPKVPAAPKELADWLPVRQTRTSFRKCKPKMNVVYLKTHKTASSTLHNIVCRWGERNNLTFALPSSGVNFKYPLTTDQLVPSPSRFYNVLANHARFEPHGKVSALEIQVSS